MTLRLRLVLALVALLLVGLTLFGLTTYSVYARSQYARLDDQIRSSVPFVTRQLYDRARFGTLDIPARDRGGPGPLVPLSTYSELRDGSGAVLVTAQLSDATARPRLPESVDGGPAGRFFSTGATAGAGRWRVYASPASGPSGTTIIVAVPLDEVASSLRRLVVIEVGADALLMAALCSGAWLILRRGLRPLEHMASTAGAIAAGDLTRRVEPAGGPSEVGQLGGALNTMLDEIERAFAERDATEHRLRQFLADASHELRTPLTSIQGFAELFRIGEHDRVDVPTILRRIEQESARMRVLVEDLLLLARLDETRAVERRTVDLAVLAADACSDAVAAARDRPLTLDAPAPVVVAGDQALLRQAIGNLVSNAVRHTPSGTAIDVSAALEDGQAVVRVRDHGDGLGPESLEHVFDRFWQADRARSGPGAGLGLSIVAAVAAEHGGHALAANADGGGALFTLRIPAGPAAGA
ncbi:MAG: HAMP domain-containing sensor histidine kinase [Acidimicrobiales bacterium]